MLKWASLALLSWIALVVVAPRVVAQDSRDPVRDAEIRDRSGEVLANISWRSTLRLELPPNPRGIGKVTVEWGDVPAPERLVVSLPLRGLEHFSVSDGETAWLVSVSSHDGSVRCSRQDRSGPQVSEENPIPSDSMDAILVNRHVLANDTRHTCGFTIELPLNDLSPSAHSLRIEWIDFYR